jgi:diguanylate cyclase (GGDEF)-like protein
VEGNASLAQELALQIGYFGYEVEVFDSIEGFQAALGGLQPAAVILDISPETGGLGGVSAMSEIQRSRQRPIPIVFISSRGDLRTRLHAVRAGGSAYFTKPVDVGSLIDKLDALTSRRPPEPVRVLIVEESPALADHYSRVLEQAGMVTATVTDPMKVLDQLAEFRPDIMLVDLYMPECNGIELAAAVRQEEAYVSTPIVFLAPEADAEKQLAAISLGGDDFLARTIEPERLVSSVASRVQRARVLRSLMVRDSLTGLLNHTATKEQLDIQLARAKRQNMPLAFAMLDIDRFKSVNDTYGHAAGDRVLKSLSRLLQQRLRGSDIVGRYGGEEFAVILNDTDGEDAVKVIDKIRENFARVRHHAGEEEFTITFSAGIASFPPYETPLSLNEAADHALYQAKGAGRNRVVLAAKDAKDTGAPARNQKASDEP